MEIQSSLLDLERCLTASESERLQSVYKRANRAISRVRFLASHLVDVVPGNSKSLLAMATEASRCNAPAFDVMQVESMGLL
ncbi:hypothetical protein DPMN_166640 [Dreissena polymorpha]|uniref:Uncharacterized protein n=1 Tax=Dreissena polymorpha TaxID=45954 RepID=A0A9D4IUC0_DREPO|nr:hypothetical protein DPMN_166640 [Dreissena polymorpha]